MTSHQGKSASKQTQCKQAHDADKMEESLAAMIAFAMKKQQQFIEAQFKTLQDRLDNIQSGLSGCSNGVKELRDRHSILSSQVGKREKNQDKCATRWTTFEEKIADLEDRSQRDKVRILNLPEGVETTNITAYISRKSPINVDGKDIRFNADYSAFTINRHCSFMDENNKSQKIGFQTFLMYPAQLKLTRGSTQSIFKTLLDVEDFLRGLAAQESEEG